MSSIARDIRFGTRSLRKHLGLSVVAVFALTLGIGLTTTVFSIVYGALMKGLPYPDGDRIAVLTRVSLTDPRNRGGVSLQDFVDYRTQQRSFADLGAYTSGTLNVSG